MGLTNDASSESRRLQAVFIVIFLAIVAGGIVDLILDRPTTWRSPHVLFEAALVLMSLTAAAYLARGWFQSERRVRSLERAVEAKEVEREGWRRRAGELLDGFGVAIGRQFDAWGLTPAERETAYGLIRGHSLKRIARESGRSERTARQHAVAVYRKARVAGRAELAGFFLSDLDIGGPVSERDASALS